MVWKENKEKIGINIFPRICPHQNIPHILPTKNLCVDKMWGRRENVDLKV